MTVVVKILIQCFQIFPDIFKGTKALFTWRKGKPVGMVTLLGGILEEGNPGGG